MTNTTQSQALAILATRVFYGSWDQARVARNEILTLALAGDAAAMEWIERYSPWSLTT